MKLLAKCVLSLLVFGTVLGHAQISSFKHIVVVFQENRTPDNLFQGLCAPPFGTSSSCSTTPTGSQYNIQTRNWLDKHSATRTTQPTPVPLGNSYDLSHAHSVFNVQCDANAMGACQMDGSGDVVCSGTCPAKPQFRFVDNTTGILDPYLNLVTQYGWANYMFQTNQGPSFPAHQFIFGGTSAPSAFDDAGAIFAAENITIMKGVTNGSAGCVAVSTTGVELIKTQPDSTPTRQRVYECLSVFRS